MTNDIMSASLSTTNRIQEPQRIAGAPTTGTSINARQLLPGSGEKLPPASDKSATPSDKLADVVKHLNDYVQSIQSDLQFSVDEDSGRTVVKVVDTQTKEVIRQFPSEEALNLAKTLPKGEGLLIRAKA